MSNKTLYLAVSCAALVLTASLTITAVQHQLWKEFAVSLGVVIVSAGACLYLLRRS